MDEQKKYDVIKRLVEENGNKDRAAMTLGLTRRQVNRLILAYRENGKLTGRKPHIPPMAHPGRSRAFWEFVKMQEHHLMDGVPA